MLHAAWQGGRVNPTSLRYERSALCCSPKQQTLSASAGYSLAFITYLVCLFMALPEGFEPST